MRPLRRRALRIARPARVRMRRRKPCTLARRRLFGWNVLLLIVCTPRLDLHEPGSGRERNLGSQKAGVNLLKLRPAPPVVKLKAHVTADSLRYCQLRGVRHAATMYVDLESPNEENTVKNRVIPSKMRVIPLVLRELPTGVDNSVSTFHLSGVLNQHPFNAPLHCVAESAVSAEEPSS